jgi:hypothetical protein
MLAGMRRAALACGIAAALIGWVALAYDLYGPTYSYATCTTSGTGPEACRTGTASLVQSGLQPITAVFIALVALLFLLVFIASLLLFLRHRLLALGTIGATLVLLAIATALSGFSIGYSFLPSDALALVVMILTLRRSAPSPLKV